MPQLTTPLALLLWLPVAAFVALVWRAGTGGARTPRAWLVLAVRLAACALVVLAIAGLSLRQDVGRQAVVFVGDLSASDAGSSTTTASFIASAIAARQPDDAFAVVATARDAQVDTALGTSGTFSGFHTSVNADGTNLAAGLDLAGALIPAGYRGRVVLLSDGQETTGDAATEALALRARGIQTDVVPVPTATGPEVLVDHVDVPSVVHQGERFAVGVSAVATQATTATVQVFVDGTPAGQQQVDLAAGATGVTFGLQAASPGPHEVRAVISSPDDTLPQNNEARAIVDVQGPPRVLLLEGKPGEGANLANALTGSGILVDVHAPADLPTDLGQLSGYGAVVLADVSADELSDQQLQALKTLVHDLGHGLLAVGGPNSFGEGGYAGTPLDDALPVSSTVVAHRDQGRVAMVLAMDVSGSMADPTDPQTPDVTKIDMAKQAAQLTVQQLAPKDEIGVLAFNSDSKWVVPLNSVQAAGADTVQQQIASLAADGGTNIYPALQEAYKAISRVTDAQYKHLILMTDGQSCCPGNYDALLGQMHQNNITVSTIAIGADADTQLLQHLAQLGSGRYYFASNAQAIPRLMTREARLATQGPLVEGSIQPRVNSADPLIASAADAGLPQLSGYLVTSPKDLSDVMLASAEDDPILARWQYGLGRAVAWTSDLQGQWSADWVTWPGLQSLFSGLLSWTIPPAQGALQVDVQSQPGTATISVQQTQPGNQPDQLQAVVYAPDGTSQTVNLSATAPGQYQGTFPTSSQTTYLVHVQQQQGSQTVATADAALAVSYSPEFRRLSVDTPRLDQIARAGGGHTLTQPSDAFAADLPAAFAITPLTWQLLLAAAILLPVEVALRRLRIFGLDALDRLPSRPPARAVLRARTGSAHRRRRQRRFALAPLVVQRLRLPWRQHRTPAIQRGAAVVAHASPPRPNLTPPPPPPVFPTEPTALDRAGEESPYLVTLRWLEAKRRAQEQQDNP